MDRSELHTYGGLAATTTLYAILLQRYKRLIEPDLTIAEIIIGTLICLTAARIRARHGDGSGSDYERAVRMAFVWGGLPIVGWQIWEMRERYRAALADALEGLKRHADTTEIMADTC
jgi:hypothetical protein